MELVAATERFLLNRSAHCSTKTVTWYCYILTDLCHTFKDWELASLTAAELDAYLVQQRTRTNRARHKTGRKLSPATLADMTRGIKVFFKWCARSGLLPADPSVSLQSPRVQDAPKALTLAQVERLAYALESPAPRNYWPNRPRDKALFYFLLDTGCRASEALQLDLGPNLCLLEGWAQVKGKGNKTRLVGLTAPTVALVARYTGARTAGPLWLDTHGERLSYDGLYQCLKHLGRLAGIKVAPHVLRHTFATLYLESQGQAEHLQTLLGHTDPRTTARYTQAVKTRAALAEHRTHSPVVLIADLVRQSKLF